MIYPPGVRLPQEAAPCLQDCEAEFRQVLLGLPLWERVGVGVAVAKADRESVREQVAEVRDGDNEAVGVMEAVRATEAESENEAERRPNYAGLFIAKHYMMIKGRLPTGTHDKILEFPGIPAFFSLLWVGIFVHNTLRI